MDGVTSFFWTLYEFCSEDLLPFLFADAEDDRAQYTMVVYNVMAQLRKPRPRRGRRRRRNLRTFRELVDLVTGGCRRAPV